MSRRAAAFDYNRLIAVSIECAAEGAQILVVFDRERFYGRLNVGGRDECGVEGGGRRMLLMTVPRPMPRRQDHDPMLDDDRCALERVTEIFEVVCGTKPTAICRTRRLASCRRRLSSICTLNRSNRPTISNSSWCATMVGASRSQVGRRESAIFGPSWRSSTRKFAFGASAGCRSARSRYKRPRTATADDCRFCPTIISF